MPKSRARLQAGVIHLLPLVVVVVAIIFVLGLLLLRGGVVKKAPEAPRTARQQVGLTSGYSNPLDRNTQYVNPFASYKNPFDTID